MVSDNGQSLAERNSIIASALVVRGEAQLNHEQTLAPHPAGHRHGNVPVHTVRIENTPPNLGEPLTATVLDTYDDVDSEVDPRAYQSRFREDFETSATPQEIRQLSQREIPDSQEDPADLGLDLPDAPEYLIETEDYVRAATNDSIHTQEDLQNLEQDDRFASNDYSYAQEDLSDAEDVVNAERRPQYTLHREGININGRLPIEDPRFADDDEMEEQATQELTQPYLDPRRMGDYSEINRQNESEVVCTLHPASPAAYKAVEFIAQSSPQHILQNDGLSHVLEEVDEVPGWRAGQDHALNSWAETDCDANDLPLISRNGSSAQDIALRLSSRVHDVCLGWTFGRSARQSDMVICDKSQAPKISSMHFRIHVNASGVLMLEDHSMNGTFVDGKWLCKRVHDRQDARIPVRRMLNQGSEVRVMTVGDQKDGIRFLVGIPRRDNWHTRWGQKLAEYLAYVAQMQRLRETAAKATKGGNGLMMPPSVPMNPLGLGRREEISLSANALSQLAAGTEQFSYGMHWPGGDKYNVVGYIGKGAFALVYKLATKQDGEPFAAKQLEKRRFVKDGILDQKIHNELLIMKDLSHPNIVKYVDHHELPQYLYIIMEYVPHGDLTCFTSSQHVMPEYLCQTMARQVCSALEYLHKRKITHRDIKPDNILIASNEPFVVKLSDFGLSKVITNEETFLKTFCGTLLYCAPEVYPGYDRFIAGKRGKRRRDEPTPRTSPYKQSVDIWAFAAVLYHLLCGTPPWTGSAEDRGALMLETVMTVPADYDRLRRAGVSEEGIKFLDRMLVTDPGLRSTEAECLQHPWLNKIKGSWDEDIGEMDVGTEGLVAIEEDEEEELDASQLSLNDRHADHEIDDSDEEFVSDVDELLDTRESKRFKSHHISQGEPSSAVTYPQLPNMQGVQPRPASTHPAGNRLFGEIGASALRSSGVLGNDAHAALQMTMEGNRDEGASAFDIHYSSNYSVTSDGDTQHELQYPRTLPGPNFTASAPSLFGAETLVGQLNMASPESGVSGPSASTSAAPTTPNTRGPSPMSPEAVGSKRSSHDHSEAATPKRAKSSHSEAQSQPSGGRSTQRQQSISDSRGASKQKTRGRQATDSPSKSRDNKMSKDKGVEQAEPKKSTEEKDKVVEDTESKESTEGKGKGKAVEDTEPKKSTEGKGMAVEDTEPKKSTEGKKDKAVEKTEPTKSTEGTKEAGVSTSHPNNQDPNQSSSSSNASTSTPATNDASNFTKPPPRLGTLTPLPGSITTPTIKLEKRITTYGRDPGSMFQHRDTLDTRIPKCALDILFWRPGIEAHLLKHPEADWAAFDDIYAILSTRCAHSIQVNGVTLRKGEGCWKFGRLATGDIVTIFEPVGKHGQAAEFLKFKCEFLVGASKGVRKEGQEFVVEREEEKWLRWQMERSRGGSSGAGPGVGGSSGAAGSSAGAGVAGTSGSAAATSSTALAATTTHSTPTPTSSTAP